MAAVTALMVLAALATPTFGSDHAPLGHTPPGPAPSLEPADGRRGARAFRIPAPYRPLVHMRPHSETEPGTTQQPQEVERRTGGGSDRTPTAQLLASTGCRQGERCDTTPQRTQELIEKFLKELAASTRDRTPAEAVRDHDNKIDQGDQRRRPATTQEPTNRLASLYLDNEQAADQSSSTSSSSESSSSETSEADAGSGEVDREGEGSSDAGWSVLESKSHRHPYDDRDGWVTLEPVPWAAAKVSKWRPNPGRRPPWVTLQHAYGEHQSSAPHDRWDRPQAASPWHGPTLEYPQPARPSLAADPYDYLGHHHHGDIITDERPLHHAPWSGEVGGAGGSPAHSPPQPPAYGPPQPPHHRPSYSFPTESLGLDSFHRHHHQQQHHPASYPGEADGEWVLLSSTKGYSLPKHRRLHQRAVSFSARPLTARRSVRLTVLPAQNGTTNTSTSHGGLLEVHSSFNSVEQDARDRDQHQHDHQNGVVPAQDVPVFAGSPTRPTAATVPVLLGVRNGTNSTTQFGGRPLRQQYLQLIPGRKGTTANPGRALLAAVGAGVLPATVAMLVPLALGRRRRRSTSLGDYPSEDTLLVADATTVSTRKQNEPARRVNRLHQKRF